MLRDAIVRDTERPAFKPNTGELWVLPQPVVWEELLCPAELPEWSGPSATSYYRSVYSSGPETLTCWCPLLREPHRDIIQIHPSALNHSIFVHCSLLHITITHITHYTNPNHAHIRHSIYFFFVTVFGLRPRLLLFDWQRQEVTYPGLCRSRERIVRHLCHIPGCPSGNLSSAERETDDTWEH